MKIINDTLKALDGKALQNSSNPPGHPPKDNDPALLISEIISNCCLVQAPPGQPYRPEKAAARYQLAVYCFGKAIGDELDIPADLVVELDVDISRYYPVTVAGQMHELLK